VSAIKVGDLVAVVRWPCCKGALGEIWKVASLFVSSEVTTYHASCAFCGAKHGHNMVLASSVGYANRQATVPVPWLKRIPPLDELERDQIVDELTCG
jgi:hypothetical protein